MLVLKIQINKEHHLKNNSKLLDLGLLNWEIRVLLQQAKQGQTASVLQNGGNL